MYFVRKNGGLPMVGAAQALKADQLDRKIDGIIAAVETGKNVAEAMQNTTVGMGVNEQQEMVVMIANRLRNIPGNDPEAHIMGVNSILLGSLYHLNTEGMDMYGLLQPYYHTVHSIPGLKSEGGEFIVDWTPAHLVDVGNLIYACNLADQETYYGNGTYSGAKKLKHQ